MDMGQALPSTAAR